MREKTPTPVKHSAFIQNRCSPNSQLEPAKKRHIIGNISPLGEKEDYTFNSLAIQQ